MEPPFPFPRPGARNTLSPAVKILRQVLGVLSLSVGLILLGECAATTAGALLHQHPDGGSSAHLLRWTLFSPGKHGTPYGILLISGMALFLMGVVLTRTWPLPFFVFGTACLALSGGVVVERVVLPKGAGASVVQDGITGIWGVLAREDALMTLWMGVAAIICGVFVNHFSRGAGKAPAGPAQGKGKKAKTPAGGTLPAPDSDPLAITPAGASEGAEARSETSVDLDLSPDLETSEVHVPDPLAGEDAPPPFEEAPTPLPMSEEGAEGAMNPTGTTEEPSGAPAPADAPYVMEVEAPTQAAPPPLPAVEAPTQAAMPEPEAPKPPVLLPALGILLGLGSLGSAGAPLYLTLEAPTAGLAWAGGVAAALAGMGLALMGRPVKALGWTAVGVSVMGLGGAATLLVLGG